MSVQQIAVIVVGLCVFTVLQQAARALRRIALALEYATEDIEPTLDLLSHLEHQRDWSLRTFGPHDRQHGVIDHVRRELEEIELELNYGLGREQLLGEWVDVIILGLDGAWRSGHTPAEVVEAIIEKQRRNESRRWPDWRGLPVDRAIEHEEAP